MAWLPWWWSWRPSARGSPGESQAEPPPIAHPTPPPGLLRWVQSPQGTRALVLGLRWRAVVVSSGPATAQALARQAQASHYALVSAGQAVGYGHLPRAAALWPTPACPAAAVAARATGGNGVFALALSRTEVWLATMHSGVPCGHEEILCAADEAQTLALALRRCRDLLPQFGWRLFTDLPLSPQAPGGAEPSIQPCTLAGLLSIPLLPAEQMQALPRTGLAALRLPRPVLVAGALGLTLWAAWTAYTHRQAAQQSLARAALARQRAQAEDPQRAWAQTLALVRTSHRHPAAASLRALRQSLDAVPSRWQGWVLQDLTCEHAPPAARLQTSPPMTGGVGAVSAARSPPGPSPAEPASSAWACKARYAPPGPGQPMATNAQLQRQLPPGFALQLAPPLGVSLHWSVPVAVAPLDLAALPTRAQHALDLGSALQQLMPLLSGELQPLVFGPLGGIKPPRRGDGSAIAAPVGLALPSQAALQLRLPLRSVDAVLAQALPVDWQRLQLSHSPNPAAKLPDAVGGEPKSSALQVHLHGVVYARD